MALRIWIAMLAVGLVTITGCASRTSSYQPCQPACRPAVVATTPVPACGPSCPPAPAAAAVVTPVPPPPPPPGAVIVPR